MEKRTGKTGLPAPVESISKLIMKMKNEFQSLRFDSTSFLQEVVPLCLSSVPDSEYILCSLHRFAASNPIYTSSRQVVLDGIQCIAYQGDINDYWLASKKHDTNYQPFYPTWMLSAYALSLGAKLLGFKEVVDIGSGDGRIAYCATILGMNSTGIEIDSSLADLQRLICAETGIRYNIVNQDATQFDYESLKLSRPMFFVSGLPEHGEMLAESVLAATACGRIVEAGFNFMGSHVMKSYSKDRTVCGWGRLIEKFELELDGIVTLPTFWTFDQKVDTAYVYSRYRQ